MKLTYGDHVFGAQITPVFVFVSPENNLLLDYINNAATFVSAPTILQFRQQTMLDINQINQDYLIKIGLGQVILIKQFPQGPWLIWVLPTYSAFCKSFNDFQDNVYSHKLRIYLRD